MASSAQATGFDDTFGSTGTVFSPVSPLGDRYYNTTRAPGGGTYNVGYTTVAGTDRAFLLTRVDASGERVSGFGASGVTFVNVVTGPYAASPSGATPTGTGEIARGIVVQSDGKIVVTGQAETPPSAGRPDSRDIDVYAARFNTNGTLDATFGTGGVKRIDLSNGVGAANTLNGDQSYGTVIRPDGKIAIVTSKGLDSAEPTRTDRDIAIVQLLPSGELDGRRPLHVQPRQRRRSRPRPHLAPRWASRPGRQHRQRGQHRRRRPGPRRQGRRQRRGERLPERVATSGKTKVAFKVTLR